MKDKKLEANLSMVASRVMAGLNMNGLKFLLPLWLGALTGCHGALCLCCRGILDNKLVCKGGTGHKAAADRAVLSGSFRTLRVHVLLSAGHQ